MTARRGTEVPEVLEVHEVPSEEVRMVPAPTATNTGEIVNPLDVVHWLLKTLPAESVTPAVTLIL